MTVLAVLKDLAVLESTLPSCCLSYNVQDEEATVKVPATPLKLKRPFSEILTCVGPTEDENLIVGGRPHSRSSPLYHRNKKHDQKDKLLSIMFQSQVMSYLIWKCLSRHE